jgi:hypothetical protein
MSALIWPARVVLAVATSALLVAGCTKKPAMDQFPEVPSDIKKQFAFACTHEASRIPPRDPEADQLYKHARWLVKANVLKQDPAAYPPIERLLRIATAHGHDRANIELRSMLDKDQAHSADPVNEAIDLVQDLIKRGIPAGYYDMGWYVDHGYGVDADQELAFKYYRKAADLGNPEGQYLVGDLLNNLAKHGPDIAAIGLAMQRCAADQGHAKAANIYAINVRQQGNRPEAMKYLQLAAVAGSAEAAHRLSKAFDARSNKDPLYNLGQAIDQEHQERYGRVWNFLEDYSYLNPKVPELDTIAPLPPAKLPPWDGKFKWLEEHEANVPPPLPTEERIAEMAKAKGLDPKTGRRVEQQK